MLIKVLGRDIQVVKKKRLLVDESCHGLYDSAAGQILIDPDQSPRDYVHTLIHEMIHAVADRVGVHTTSVNPDMVEILCENIATVIVENGAILKRYL